MIFDRESAQLMLAILCANRHGDEVVIITAQAKIKRFIQRIQELHIYQGTICERFSIADRIFCYKSGGRILLCSSNTDANKIAGLNITTAWFDELGEPIDEQRLAQVVLDRVSRKRNTRNKNP